MKKVIIDFSNNKVKVECDDTVKSIEFGEETSTREIVDHYSRKLVPQTDTRLVLKRIDFF